VIDGRRRVRRTRIHSDEGTGASQRGCAATAELEVENVADASYVDALAAVLDALSRGEAQKPFAARTGAGEATLD
jgi:hypothetical protein